MSEIESAARHFVAIIDPSEPDEACVALIEARDNAVRAALIDEIESLAKSNDARNEDFAYLIRDAVDKLRAKYTQPKEPKP